MKLKDYKDKIKGWPEKKLHTHDSIPCFIGEEDLGCMICIGNKIIVDFENLEFNPAELVELDEKKLLKVVKEADTEYINEAVESIRTGNKMKIGSRVECVAQAIVKAFKAGEISK